MYSYIYIFQDYIDWSSIYIFDTSAQMYNICIEAYTPVYFFGFAIYIVYGETKKLLTE